MTNNLEHFQLKENLTLRDRTHSPLTIHNVTLSLTKQDNELIECRLTFQITPQLYQHIDTNGLFNLQPDVRNPLTSGEFLPEFDITIETSLKPDLLPQLAAQVAKINETATYLLNLSQEQPDNPILSTDSWLGLSVKQQQESGEIGYRTFWSYISPAAIAQTTTSQEEISQAIVNFFKDWTETNFSATTQKATSEMLAGINNLLTELADVKLDKITYEIAETFPATSTARQMFEEIINFFQTDDWPFVQSSAQPTLQTSYQGENGTWNCYANARVEQQQFIFYSVCPVNAPENKRLAIAEYLTRANSGILIGNFELDFEDGEIRYKTGIDVEGDRLSFALIKQLVYANVTMMDEYLPGIMSVIYGDASAEKAINQIELIPDIHQSSNEQEQLLSVVPVDHQQKLAVNPSPQAEIQQQEEKVPERQSHILARITPDEIGQLHQALQMLEPYQRKETQAILEKVKRLMIARLGDLGTEVFNEAFTFFTKVKFPGIILKLIQRYSRMAGQTRLFVQQLKDWIKQYGEAADNSDINLAIEDLEKLFGRINKRLEELPTDKLLGEKELIYLLEIEQFREQLAFFDRLVKNIEIPPSPP